jgi:hypothetical protein
MKSLIKSIRKSSSISNVFTTLLILAMSMVYTGCKETVNHVSFIVDTEDIIANAETGRWALSQLQQALVDQNVAFDVYASLDEAPADSRCVLVAGGESKVVSELMKAGSVTLPDSPEALALLEGEIDRRKLTLACGSDARGLTYALLELADRMNYGATAAEAVSFPEPVTEVPSVRMRSIYRTFTSDIEDKGWYNDKDFWRAYLTELATQRINRFSLSLGMGYNVPRDLKDSYFFFAYPFLVDVPAYDVYAENLPDEERDNNLDMLKFISEETAKRGMEFQLALWSHGKDWTNSEDVNYPIIGLTDENHASYCRDALYKILQACPAITGVTFRVHYESGIPKGEEDFWKVLFEALPKTGRPIWIDMHGKHITQEQINSANATGMPVSISPKFTGEQQGLAYHQTDIRRREKGNIEFIEPETGVFTTTRVYTRYGYGDFLPENKDWEVLHRIWPGTQRFLLTGDPALSAGYGEIFSYCGSQGVERLDPLTFKGRRGSGYPGGRCAYADKSLEPKWDFQKYLYTYRLWGRLVYNPDSDPDVWQRFLRQKFGKAADPIETAIAHSSRVLPLITTAHGPSADCKVYWPEIYNNQPIVKVDPDYKPYRDTDKPELFGNVSPFDPQLFSRMNAYAASLLEGEKLAQYSPLEVAKWLDELADVSEENLKKAASRVADKEDLEFRRVEADVLIQCGIARFFAQKMRSAVLYHLYEGSGDTDLLEEAVARYQSARDTWKEMAEGPGSVYVSDISFGELMQLQGHWSDRVPHMDMDIQDMKEVLEQAKAKSGTEAKGGTEANDGSDVGQPAADLLAIIDNPPARVAPECSHTPAAGFVRGEAMEIELGTSRSDYKKVALHYRHVNQAEFWQKVEMKREGEKYMGEIPAEYADSRYPLSYYFTIDTGEPKIIIYPGLDENLSNMPYYTVRQEK